MENLTKYELEKINKYIEKYGVDEKISKFEERVAHDSNNFNKILYSKVVKYADIELMEDSIIKTNDPMHIFNFAYEVKKSNKAKLSKAIAETREPALIRLFAKYVEKPDFEVLEQGIIDCADPMFMYSYARTIEKANIEKLEDAVIKTGNLEYMYYFAKNIRKANIDKFQKAAEKADDSFYKTLLENVYEDLPKNDKRKKAHIKELKRNKVKNDLNEVIKTL